MGYSTYLVCKKCKEYIDFGKNHGVRELFNFGESLKTIHFDEAKLTIKFFAFHQEHFELVSFETDAGDDLFWFINDYKKIKVLEV